MQVCRTRAELEEARAGLPDPVGFVPTMGALHAGHLALVGASAAQNAATVVSIFVNPSQFGPGEDFARYPRALSADLAMLEPAGVDLVFAPEVETIYPAGFATWVVVEGPLAERLEGEHRPGHFRGVATVVTRLLLLAGPAVAYFGQKDAQQLAVVRRVATDLALPSRILAVPTVREPDGLALSSRNRYLSPTDRRAAPVLARSLATARSAYRDGTRAADALIASMRAVLASEPLLSLEYVDLVDPDTFEAAGELDDRTLAVLAGRLGTTRLIDNAALGESPDGARAIPSSRPV